MPVFLVGYSWSSTDHMDPPRDRLGPLQVSIYTLTVYHLQMIIFKLSFCAFVSYSFILNSHQGGKQTFIFWTYVLLVSSRSYKMCGEKKKRINTWTFFFSSWNNIFLLHTCSDQHTVAVGWVAVNLSGFFRWLFEKADTHRYIASDSEY